MVDILFMEKDIKNLVASVEIIAQTTATILERVNSIETDLKGFKQETRDNFDSMETKIDYMNDTLMNYDKRIEKIEDKV